MHQIEGRTFTLWYDPAEDRLRMAVNIDSQSARKDLWITRRFLISLVSGAESYLSDKISSTPPQEFSPPSESGGERVEGDVSEEESGYRREESSTRMEIETGVDAGMPDAELLRNFNLKWFPDHGRMLLSLRGDETEVVATLTPENVCSLLKLMLEKSPYMEWGISPSLLSC